MRTTKVAVVYIVLCLAVTCRALGQEHDRFENVCSSLQNATPPDRLTPRCYALFQLLDYVFGDDLRYG